MLKLTKTKKLFGIYNCYETLKNKFVFKHPDATFGLDLLPVNMYAII